MPAPPSAHRVAQVLNPVIPTLGTLLKAHPDALSLGQGMVAWGPPDSVRTALVDACRSAGASDRYGPMAGDPQVLEGIHQALLRQRHPLDLASSALLVTAGSNMAFHAIAQVICDPGDQVILPTPYYFNHVMAVQLAGGQPVPIDAGIVPDPEQLASAINERTRAIVTTSPGNPSGAVLPPEQLEAINRLCARHGLFHVHDEAYADFCHGPIPHWSPGALSGSSEHTVTLRSFSKSHGMAGWRLGYLAAPQQLLPALAKVQDTIAICPSRPMQRAALAAVTVPERWVEDQVATLQSKRLGMVERFQQADTPWRLLGDSDGALYGFADLEEGLGLEPALGQDTLMTTLVERFGVGVVSGSSFGMGAASFRISYGMLDDDSFNEAMARLMRGLRQLAGNLHG